MRSFQKNATFCVLLRSFAKERCVLCILLRSLQKNVAVFAFFYILCKRTLRSFTFLTLIHLTPYHYSYHLTYLPFPSAQCEYLFWIRSGGNVSISFFLRRGGRGRSVHCTLYMEGRRRRGRELGLILDENMRFFTLF